MSSDWSGFNGKMLRVNLSSDTVEEEETSREMTNSLLGGKGYCAGTLFQEMKRGVDPLGEENKIMFMTGPLTGTRAPTGNRFCICTKSPLTGTWLDSHCGGSWGPELKWSGFDGIIVEGMSEDPKYLAIDEHGCELEDASWLWGADTFTTERFLKDKHSGKRRSKVLEIGPAGERGALLASILSEVRAAGRGGAGAVMGSKGLKAIVVSGNVKGPGDLVKDEENFLEAVKEAHRKIAEDFRTSRSKEGALVIRGTCNIIHGINEAGGWPTRNFQEGSFEEVEAVSGESFSKKLWVPREAPGSRPCWNCPIQCAHVGVVSEGPMAGTVTEGPEYETVWAFGPQCGIADRETIARGDYLSDYYGMDTISVGNTIGFLMECREKGLISPEDIDGVDLKFGDCGALLEAVNRAGTLIGKLGKLVGNGVKRAAEEIGGDSERFAMHTKGLEFPAYMPRAAQGMGLSYARSDRGACHLRPWTAGRELMGWDPMDPKTTEGKAQEVRAGTENIAVVWDSTGLCLFSSFAYDENTVLKMVNAATGFGYSMGKFLEIGERIDNLTRAFNVREGFGRADDSLPARCLEEPHRSGPCEGMVVRLDEMLDEYYELCGWDGDGVPTFGKLRDLGLEYVADQLKGK